MTSIGPSSPAENSPQGLLALGNQARRDERPEAAHDLYEKSLELARKNHDKPATARALLALADNAMWYLPPGAGDEAREESLDRDDPTPEHAGVDSGRGRKQAPASGDT